MFLVFVVVSFKRGFNLLFFQMLNKLVILMIA